MATREKQVRKRETQTRTKERQTSTRGGEKDDHEAIKWSRRRRRRAESRGAGLGR